MAESAARNDRNPPMRMLVTVTLFSFICSSIFLFFELIFNSLAVCLYEKSQAVVKKRREKEAEAEERAPIESYFIDIIIIHGYGEKAARESA